MAKVLILKGEDPEAAASPEMRYLLSLVRLEAERAFGEAWVGTVEGWNGSGADRVLLVGATDVLLMRPSLERMEAALGAGAEVAVPSRVADVGLPAGFGAYTLRDFERAEAAFLAGGAEPALTLPGDLLPASLWRPEALRRIAARVPLERLLSGELEGAGSGGDGATGSRDGGPDCEGESLAFAGDGASGLRAVRAGLCHEFIDYYGEVRSDVIPFLPDGAREVLEVGCGRGATGEYLQRELGCRVTGVELNPVVARAAAGRLHRVVVGDVEDAATVAELEAPYDALLALELFEHLVEPERFLERVRPLVRPGGRLVLSVPNVGHHSVVADLLAGRWDYLPIGILCYTHYRFYTRHTLADWLARCGFPEARLVPQHTEPPTWLPPDAAPGQRLPGLGLPADPESLRTKGFYVLLDV